MGEYDYVWQHRWKEWRHSPCLMRPVTMVTLIIMIIFWTVTMVFTLPGWLLGLLLAPILSRGTWLIEFLYPLPLARWGHLVIMRWSKPKVPLDDKAANYHSRTLEQRIEVVKGRVWIHPIPQFVDNLGYLVVCLPPPPPKPHVQHADAGETPLGRVSVTQQYEPDQDKAPKGHIVAFLVDCGDAETVDEQLPFIRESHYPEFPPIQIHMVLSTHKHHDHTAGNKALKTLKAGRNLDFVVGGAVERVPGCNVPVADGDILKLPICGRNNMNDLVYVEVIAVPAHTRGSVVYILRRHNNYNYNNNNNNNNKQTTDFACNPCFVFTGDTMFSGGGGVPFEAGSDPEVENGAYRDNAHGSIRAGLGSHAVERCFAEILVRGTVATENTSMDEPRSMQDRFLIFPGHEYTTELLSRQFGVPPSGNLIDANKWKNYPPAYFFETASELYVALHRRSLPQATGKVLAAAPTTLRREMAINPHLRSLARRAELVVHAIKLWDAYFCKPKSPKGEEAAAMRMRIKKMQADNQGSLTRPSRAQGLSDKTSGTENSWNMDARDAAKTVFTTVYTSELDAIINDLTKGKLDPDEAALKLEALKSKLQEPVIRRRPIPGTLPSERVVFKGLVGFALLGSRPCAMTLSDSHAMKLPPPVIRDTSCILISKKRLIVMLSHLGLLDSVDGPYLVTMIHSLWREAHEYNGNSDANTVTGSHHSKYNGVGKPGENGHDTTDDEEESGDAKDLVSLGTLKWILYGFPARQPSWFSRFCMPCRTTPSERNLEKRQGKEAQAEHPVQVSSMKRRHGELIRHDVMTCMLCRNAAGCPESYEESDNQVDDGSDRLEFTSHYLSHYNDTSDSIKPVPDFRGVSGGDDDSSLVTTSNDSAVEVSTMTSLLRGGSSSGSR